MSRDVASIFAAAEERPAPASGFRTCHICTARRPAAEVHVFLAPFKEGGWRDLPRCIDAYECRVRVEEQGEAWPLRDRTPPPLPSVSARNASPPNKPAVEAAPDPPLPQAAAEPEQATPTEAPYADLDDGDGWFR